MNFRILSYIWLLFHKNKMFFVVKLLLFSDFFYLKYEKLIHKKKESPIRSTDRFKKKKKKKKSHFKN